MLDDENLANEYPNLAAFLKKEVEMPRVVIASLIESYFPGKLPVFFGMRISALSYINHQLYKKSGKEFL